MLKDKKYLGRAINGLRRRLKIMNDINVNVGPVQVSGNRLKKWI